MNIINDQDLSDESTRKLISEYQEINRKIDKLEAEIEIRKKDLTFNDGYGVNFAHLKPIQQNKSGHHCRA